jgi:Protein kinase domain
VIDTHPDLATTLFTLPPDAKFLPVSELSARLRARIGPVEDGQSVITRPGFRVTTRLVPGPLADLIAEFRAPTLLTDAVLRFARARDQDPFATLDVAFDALATLVEGRILVPLGSPDALAPTPSLAAGQEFAGFEIEALVRSLEDSEVYRAHRQDGGVAALKIARDDRPGVTAMIANEARVLERLEGTDSPRLLDDGTEHGRAYVAMEWCDGVSIAVAAQQARAARDRRRLHNLVGRMLEAYGRLHRTGVLHGDIHPGNCLVRDDGRVVILDFGNARPIDAARAVDPVRSGIPQFHDPQMACALLAGRLPPAATPASEQYAIAVLAYLLLTGLQPIDAPAVHDELLQRIVQRSALPFAARGVPAWPEVEAVLGRGLAKRPADRFPDVASLARAFSLAGLPPDMPSRWPDAAQRAFDTAVEAVRSLAPSGAPRDHAWFAMRAALALEDAELLAAADVLVGRAGPGWAVQAVAALVARARSDSRMEGRAIAGFLAAAERLPDGPEAGAAILAAATVLEGAMSRSPDAAGLAGWAARRLDRLMRAPPATDSAAGIADPQLTYVALSLGKTGAVALRADLPAHLDALSETHASDVWLWALAHDVFADDRFRARALAARLPSRPLGRGFALLRLHQLTGDMHWVAEANRLVAKAPSIRLPALDTALLMAELKAPERAILPAFLFPLSTRRPRRHAVLRLSCPGDSDGSGAAQTPVPARGARSRSSPLRWPPPDPGRGDRAPRRAPPGPVTSVSLGSISAVGPKTRSRPTLIARSSASSMRRRSAGVAPGQ